MKTLNENDIKKYKGLFLMDNKGKDICIIEYIEEKTDLGDELKPCVTIMPNDVDDVFTAEIEEALSYIDSHYKGENYEWYGLTDDENLIMIK